MCGLVTAVAIGAVATVASAAEARKAGKAQKKSIAVQQRQADIQASRDRLAAIRESRLARGAIAQQSATAGVTVSSGNIGSQGGNLTALASEIGTQQQMQQLGQEGSMFNQKAADAQSMAAVYGAIGNLSMSLFSTGGGFKKLGEQSGGG